MGKFRVNSIYRTSWGDYIDLSHLNAVTIDWYVNIDIYYMLELHFILNPKPLVIEGGKVKIKRYRDEIIEQWKKYKGE